MEDVTITKTHDDVVQVMRAWDIEAPDWTPQYRTRPIAPRRVVGVWINGTLNRAAVSGPYRLKSGKLAEPKFDRDQTHIGGTGDPDHRPDLDRMQYTSDTPTSYDLGRFPAWVWPFLRAHAPVPSGGEADYASGDEIL